MNIISDNAIDRIFSRYAFDECSLVYNENNVEPCKGDSTCAYFAKDNGRCEGDSPILHFTGVSWKSNQLRFHHTFATQKMRRKLLAREVSLDSLEKTSPGGFHAR